MSKHIVTEHFTNELFELLDETFEHVHGYYLDKGTSFFETLETVSAEEASRPVTSTSASIAAKVEHVRFYLQVLGDGLEKKTTGKINWQESWQLQEVTPEEWESLKQQLRTAYQRILTLLKGFETWEGDDICDAIAIVVHTAYHLGAIRQALSVVK